PSSARSRRPLRETIDASSGRRANQPLVEILFDEAASALEGITVAGPAPSQHDQHVTLLERKALLRSDPDSLPFAEDVRGRTGAGLASEDSWRGEHEPIAVRRQGHVVPCDQVPPAEPHATAMPAGASRLGANAVLQHAEEFVVEIHGFDRDVAAVRKRAVHRIA